MRRAVCALAQEDAASARAILCQLAEGSPCEDEEDFHGDSGPTTVQSLAREDVKQLLALDLKLPDQVRATIQRRLDPSPPPSPRLKATATQPALGTPEANVTVEATPLDTASRRRRLFSLALKGATGVSPPGEPRSPARSDRGSPSALGGTSRTMDSAASPASPASTADSASAADDAGGSRTPRTPRRVPSHYVPPGRVPYRAAADSAAPTGPSFSRASEQSSTTRRQAPAASGSGRRSYGGWDDGQRRQTDDY